jgi:hypothetical protein
METEYLDSPGQPTFTRREREKIMIKFVRILGTLLAGVSLALIGTAGAASAHPRHVTPVVVHHATGARMHANGEDWCC